MKNVLINHLKMHMVYMQVLQCEVTYSNKRNTQLLQSTEMTFLTMRDISLH